MGELADRLDDLRVRVIAPNGALSAELRGGEELRLEFQPGYYYQADEREIEPQLTALCRLLWVAQTRAFEKIIADEGGETLTAARAREAPDIEYFQRLEELVARGSSADGRVAVTASRGMQDWTVKIQEGTLRALHEGEFATRAAEAAAAVIRDQFDQVLQLKQQVYNPLLNGKRY